MTTQYNPADFNLVIKSVKIAGGEETVRFELKLYINNKFAATISNDGTGGPNVWYWQAKDLELVFNQHVQHLEAQGKFEFNFEQGDQIIDEMVAAFAENQQLKKWCRTMIVCLLKSHKAGEYTTFTKKYSPLDKESLEKRFGDELVEIINERFIKK